MGFMQPQVWQEAYFEIETSEGTEIIPASVATPTTPGNTAHRRRVLALIDNEEYEELYEELGDYLDGDEIYDAIRQKGWLAQLSASGYMDQTDLATFKTEHEAWDFLIEQYPEAFTWNWQPGSGFHIYMETPVAAQAMIDTVQTLDGNRLERESEHVYVGGYDSSDEEEEHMTKELEDAGFNIEER